MVGSFREHIFGSDATVSLTVAAPVLAVLRGPGASDEMILRLKCGSGWFSRRKMKRHAPNECARIRVV